MVGVLFVVECLGLFGLMSLVKLFNENWRMAFIATVSLCVICLIIRLFTTESYKWLNKVGRPQESVESMNYCCRMQNEPFIIA